MEDGLKGFPAPSPGLALDAYPLGMKEGPARFVQQGTNFVNGVAANSNTNVTITWPVAFSTLIRVVCSMNQSGGASTGYCELKSASVTQAVVKCHNSDVGTQNVTAYAIGIGT